MQEAQEDLDGRFRDWDDEGTAGPTQGKRQRVCYLDRGKFSHLQLC